MLVSRVGGVCRDASGLWCPSLECGWAVWRRLPLGSEALLTCPAEGAVADRLLVFA